MEKAQGYELPRGVTDILMHHAEKITALYTVYYKESIEMGFTVEQAKSIAVAKSIAASVMQADTVDAYIRSSTREALDKDSG